MTQQDIAEHIQDVMNRYTAGGLYEQMGISPRVIELGDEVCDSLKERFALFDKTAQANQLKVIGAMQKNRISAEHFNGSTGYGYNDAGRDDLEKVYADTFHTQDALVRAQITCGTHALSLALGANLRPGDEMVSISGKPYDTLEEVIGIRPSRGSLAEYGITYSQVELKEDGSFDFDAIRKALKPNTRLAAIQRSKGYLTRPSLSVEQIAEAISFVKELRPDIIVMVDNCYGEFVDVVEPSDFGGSLIKNPGGGLAPMGGYIAGTEECVENCAVRLTSPGLGRELGASLQVNRSLYQGLFLSPTVTAGALKGAVFAANLFERFGYRCIPDANERRNDIIQAIEFGCADGLKRFCEGIQAAAPP